jgi:branched-chain amino acid transport system permease protein
MTETHTIPIPPAPPPAADGAAPAEPAAPPLRPPAWTGPVRALLPLVLGVAVAVLLNEVLSPLLGGFASLLAFAGINIVLAVSLNVVNGYAGQFSIGHAGFMSVGGYLGAALIYYATYKIWGDFDFHGGWLSYDGPARGTPTLPLGPGELLFLGGCVAGGLVAAAAGWLVGLPSLRLKGDYLAIVTLGFGEIVRVVLQGTDPQIGPYALSAAETAAIEGTSLPGLLGHLGGAKSMSGLPTYATTFWVFVWVAVTLTVAVRLKYSAYGRALLSIREDEVAARSVGVDVTKYNVRAFMLSAFFAGVAGVLTASNVGQIKAGDLGFQRSFEVVIMVVLGGLGSVSGAVVAAVLLTVLPEVLRAPPSLLPWALPVVVVVAAVVAVRARRKVRGLLILLAVCAAYELVRAGAAWLKIDLAQFRMVFYALALIGLMILRPQGLLGVHELWEVWPLDRLRWDRGPLGKMPWMRRGWLLLTTGRATVAGPPASAGALLAIAPAEAGGPAVAGEGRP